MVSDDRKATLPTRTTAPDQIGARHYDHADYPVVVIVRDHEFGRLVFKLTEANAQALRGDITRAIQDAREATDD